MSVTLFPALPPVGGVVTHQVLQSIPDDKAYHTKYKPRSYSQTEQLTQQGFLTNNERHTEIIDTAKYRYSFMHNLCLEMLQLGYHMAFCELFNLVEQEKKAVLSEDNFKKSDDIPFEENQEKLTFMKDMLIAVEKAKRKGRSDLVYDAQLSLAKFFSEHQDDRLADHFLNVSYNTSRQVRGDGRRKEAESNCYLGQSAERQKNYISARKYYEEFYLLTIDKDWVIEDGTLLRKYACDYLQRVYIQLSDQTPIDHEEDVLNYLHKAYEIAKEGADINAVGKVGYLIGKKYDYYGNQEEAVKYHNYYLELCESISDDIGTGKACQALAYANQRQGNSDAALEYLKKFLHVSERSGVNDNRREACSDLGALYQSMGKYEQSSNYYRKAFELSQKTSSLDTIDTSSCEYAVALANGLFTGEVETIIQNTNSSLGLLLNWKSNRVQNFSSDHMTYAMFSTNSVDSGGIQPDMDEIKSTKAVSFENLEKTP